MKNRQSKIRLDNLTFERGLATSRHRAQALIMAGKVLVDGVKIEKPGKEVSPQANLSILEELPYVSRGGVKLCAALDHFKADPSNLSLSRCRRFYRRIHRLSIAARGRSGDCRGCRIRPI